MRFLIIQGVCLSVSLACDVRVPQHSNHNNTALILNPPPEEARQCLPLFWFRKCRQENVWRNLICCVLSDQVARHYPSRRASRSQPKESSSGCCHRKQLALLSPYICHGVEGAILIQITNKMFIFLSVFSILALFRRAVSVWISMSSRMMPWLRDIISLRLWNKPVCSLWFFLFLSRIKSSRLSQY